MGTGKNGTRERDTRGGGSVCPRGRKKAMKVVSRPLSNYLAAAARDLSIILTENARTNKACQSVVHLYPRSICYLIIHFKGSAVSEHDGRVFCWLCQLDIISPLINLTFSSTTNQTSHFSFTFLLIILSPLLYITLRGTILVYLDVPLSSPSNIQCISI